MGSMNPRLGYLLEAPRGPVDRAREAYRLTTRNPLSIDRPAPVLVHTPQGEDRRPEAFGPGPCPRCETRGTLGCAHQRPFEAPQLVADTGPALNFGPYSAEEDAKIAAMLVAGFTQAAIALELRRTEGSLSSRLKVLRGERRGRGRSFDATEDQRLIELRTAGLRYTEIGRAIGRDSSSVQSRLQTLVHKHQASPALLLIRGRPGSHV